MTTVDSRKKRLKDSLSLVRPLAMKAALIAAFGFYYLSAAAVGKKAPPRGTLGPAFFPTLIAAAALAICCILLVFDLLALRRGKPGNGNPKGGDSGASRPGTAVATFFLIVAYIAALEPVGFIVSTTLYLTAQIPALSPKKTTLRFVLFTAAVSAVFSGTIFFVFTRFFMLMLPAGILG